MLCLGYGNTSGQHVLVMVEEHKIIDPKYTRKAVL